MVTATDSGYFMLAAVATPRDYQCWGRSDLTTENGKRSGSKVKTWSVLWRKGLWLLSQ